MAFNSARIQELTPMIQYCPFSPSQFAANRDHFIEYIFST
jgi:hypothetical protein